MDSVTDDEECIHGLGLVSACTICNGFDKREQASGWMCRYTFYAKFQSMCPRCDDLIRDGDLVAMYQNDRVVCERCIGRDDPARLMTTWEL